jgi:hypothetical protein
MASLFTNDGRIKVVNGHNLYHRIFHKFLFFLHSITLNIFTLFVGKLDI